MKSIVTIVCILLVGISVQAQEKVGTNPGYFELLLSPSVVSRGMGNTGVATAHEGSFYYNPASVGMIGLDYRMSMYAYPVNVDLYTDIRYFSWGDIWSVVLTEGVDSRSVLAFGSAYSRIKIGPIEEVTYDYPDGTGTYFEPTMKNLSIFASFGRRTKAIDFSVGTSVKLVKEEIFNTTEDAVTADIGVSLAVPLGQYFKTGNNTAILFTPSGGYSLSNLFGSFDYGSIYSVDTSRPTGVLSEYDFPTYTRYGGALKIGIAKELSNGQQLALVTLLGTLERFKHENFDAEIDRGIELSFFEVFSYRRGSFLDEKTVGCTIKTDGLNKLLMKETGNSFKDFIQRITLSFSYAKTDTDYIIGENYKYYSLSLGIMM